MDLTRRIQADLFAAVKPPLHPAVQAKLEPLLRSLLAEVACSQPHQAASGPDQREGGDEQDHA
jgi:hypothetical protein